MTVEPRGLVATRDTLRVKRDTLLAAKKSLNTVMEVMEQKAKFLAQT